MIEAFQFDFMRHALAAGLLASVICGIMGTLVVVNRIVFLSGGIAHAAYGGIGMALGIILIDLTPGYHVDLMSYLFGSILTVPKSDLFIMLAIGGAITLLVAYYYEDLLALSYDEEFAQIRGVSVKGLYFGMIALLAVTIVMVIQVVGLILVIALLTIPPYIVEKYAKSLLQMMVGSILLGAVFTTCGLWLSYRYDISSGASIILVAGIAFLASIVIERIRWTNWKQRGKADVPSM
jgi:zinc transport system permease protein